jgi:hypothetical protein
VEWLQHSTPRDIKRGKIVNINAWADSWSSIAKALNYESEKSADERGAAPKEEYVCLRKPVSGATDLECM